MQNIYNDQLCVFIHGFAVYLATNMTIGYMEIQVYGTVVI